MEENHIYNEIVHFMVSLAVRFCKKSTVRELPTILCVSNIRSLDDAPTLQPTALASLITDDKLITCVRRGLAFLKTFLKKMQTPDGGIPVSGGSIESLRLNNIEIDIISHDAKLHGTDEYEIEEVSSKLADGTVRVKTIWPSAYLAEAYILGGMVNGKKVAGSGRFKITVKNFTSSLNLKLEETKDNKLRLKELKFTADFDDVQMNISGLEVEGNGNPEELVNNAIQRDKPKFKEMLRMNTEFLSKQALVVMNLQLQQKTKAEVVGIVNSWCNL